MDIKIDNFIIEDLPPEESKIESFIQLSLNSSNADFGKANQLLMLEVL